MRPILAFLAVLLLATFAPPALPRREPPPALSLVYAEPVPLDESWPALQSAGRLRFLGGWRLTSNDPRFGGISAMHVEGAAVLAFSDSGWMIRFPLPGPRSPVKAMIRALPRGPGASERKSARDIESMWVEGRSVWIGFERRNVVWRFEQPGWTVGAAAWPPGMRRWPPNRGPEAIVRLRDGRFLVFAEGNGRGGPVLLFQGDPAVPGTPETRFTYRPPPGYRATDAALLPDGRVLVLNRRFRLLEGITAKLALLRRGGGGILTAEELADFRPPLTVDNMEALSVTREAGRTIVWIASDDNYNPLQRTLLMKFALEG
ncbi:MAG TPA: esterase-like activity of phytase family protein [Allosphingosinicella sp.]|jgi:hypothetical protein